MQTRAFNISGGLVPDICLRILAKSMWSFCYAQNNSNMYTKDETKLRRIRQPVHFYYNIWFTFHSDISYLSLSVVLSLCRSLSRMHTIETVAHICIDFQHLFLPFDDSSATIVYLLVVRATHMLCVI